MSDLISRQAVINAIADTILNGESLGYVLAEEIVSEIPSTDIMEYARAMKEYCKERMKKPIWCNDCPLYEKVCFLFGNVPIPCKWNLPEGEKGGAE